MGNIKDMTDEDIRKYYSIIESIEKDLVKVMKICDEDSAYSYVTGDVDTIKTRLITELGTRQIGSDSP